MKDLTPLKSVHKYCLECCNYQPKEIRVCPSSECSLYPLRLGRRDAKVSTLKSIRARCLDCSGTSMNVKNCKDINCPLHPYRNGKNFKRKGIGGRISTLFKKSSIQPTDSTK